MGILQCEWDKPVPIKIQKGWKDYLSSLNYLHKLVLPRYLGTETDYVIELRAFADCSLLAYGACLYICYSIKINIHVTKLISIKIKNNYTKNNITISPRTVYAAVESRA